MELPSILGCPCCPKQEKDIFNFFEKSIGSKGYTVAINAEKILKFRVDNELKNIITNSILPYPDGAGAVIGLKWLHSLSSEKINMPKLALEYANENKIKTFIVGATEANHNAAMKTIIKRYPNIDIVGNMHGYHPKQSIVSQISDTKPDMILLALGSPRQEKFAFETLQVVDTGLIIGCGGALDILAGKIKRAPNFWINNNIEWAYRLIQEPWRFHRMLFLPKFFVFLLAEVVQKRFNVFDR